MKFWFGKKESAGEASAMKKDAPAEAAPDSASVGNGAGAALPKPEEAGHGIDLHEISAVAPADYGADKSGAPDQSSSAPVATDAETKPVASLGTIPGESAPDENAAKTAAVRTPVLKAISPTQSGAARIRPVISLKPKAQGSGLAALAAAASHAHPVKDSGGGAVAVKAPEKESDGIVADKPAATEVGKDAPAEGVEKGSAIIESDGVPVRVKPDQRALYYQLMNGLYDAILILDEKGFVVDCNTRFTDILGYAREDSWDMPIGRIIAGMSSQMLGHLKSNLAENHHIILDARCLRKDGTSFTAEVGVSVFSLTRGDNMVFMIRNVDRRKRAMDELRKGSAALEIALAPAFVCDTDGFFVIVNNAFLESFSIPDLEHAKAVRLVDLLPDAARVFLRAACGEKIRDKLQIAMPDGTGLALDVSLAPVQNGQVITGVAGSIMQI